MLHKIISGGQTGADQAALDVAREWAIPYGGWIPKGRLTERGPLPMKYDQMQEMNTACDVDTNSDDAYYAARTEQNVMDSDATLLFCRGGEQQLEGGTAYTLEMARNKHNKPCLCVDSSIKQENTDSNKTAFETAAEIVSWLEEHHVKRLNVAGPRASKDPNIYQDTTDVLTLVLSHLH